MAFTQAPERHGSASAEAVDIDGFRGVLRACGVETALPANPRAENELVAANQCQSPPACDSREPIFLCCSAIDHYRTLKSIPFSQPEAASAYLPTYAVKSPRQRLAQPIIFYLREYLYHYVNTGQG